jgi:hypothetical protein
VDLAVKLPLQVTFRHVDRAHEDPYVALRDAFRAARRKLQDYERRRYRKVKHHEELPRGRISELDTAGSHGSEAK